MRKNYGIFALVLMTSGMVSCESRLDIVPHGTPTAENFWRTQSDAIAGANAMYQQFYYDEFYGRGFMWYINASDDMVTGRANTNGDNIKDFNPAVPTVSTMNDQWRFRYIVIKRAIDVLKYVPNIEMDESLRQRILGEAHFFIGLMYFELARNYGDERAGLPILAMDAALDLNPVPRASNVSENYAIIESSFKTAAELLPYFETYSGNDYGRPHKTAAWAWLSKVYLYRSDFANAEAYADMVINSGKHELLESYDDVFTIANNWSKEYIWSAYATVTPTYWGSYLPGAMLENRGWGVYNGWGYFMPTRELYDEFEEGDERRAKTILKPDDEFMFFGEMWTYSTDNSLSGMQFNKYMEPFSYADPIGKYVSTSGNYPATALCIPLLRYAEVLLIRAEAKLMQGKNADDDINLVRKRAWGNGEDYPKVVNADLPALKHERRVELAGEWADRHRDLVRWGDAKDAYAKPLHGWDGSEIWGPRSFNPSVHHVWPVPQVEIDRSGGVIVQNAGW